MVDWLPEKSDVVIAAADVPPSQMGRLGMQGVRPAPAQADGRVAVVLVAHVQQADGEMLAARQAPGPVPDRQDMALRVRELLGGDRLVVLLGRNSQQRPQIARPDQGARPLHRAVIRLGEGDDAGGGVAEPHQSDITYIIGFRSYVDPNRGFGA